MSTGIGWTDETWTIVTGCSKVSAGCSNCYAESLAPRLAAMCKEGYTDKPWTVGNAVENVTLRPERLDQPLRWKKPRRVFVTSMGDLFHELVPDEFIDQVFAVMALASQHTFQVLTKRPERMAEYLTQSFGRIADTIISMRRSRGDKGVVVPLGHIAPGTAWWPLRNVWLGVSLEDDRVRHRLDELKRVPAVVRFLSCEPLLGPLEDLDLEGIDWVIVGGESGPNHRPMSPAWVRDIRDQCYEESTAFFFKQWGGARPASKKTEVLLDGEKWHQFPEVKG